MRSFRAPRPGLHDDGRPQHSDAGPLEGPRLMRRALCSVLLPSSVAAAVVVLAAAWARPAAAQTGPQDPLAPPRISQEVFVTATVAPLDVADLTRAITLIDRADLEQFGLSSPIEALRFVPGVDLRARGPRDVQTDVAIRGATFGQHLMLADGMRLNDSQSAHHNGEIPLPAVAIDRIEVVRGATSAVHGADAVGGTINVISRTDAHAVARLTAGQHGLVDIQGSARGGLLPTRWTLAGWTSRSDGFMVDRDFALGGGALRGSPGAGITVDIRHQRRAFGANGFYGPSPSKEWTDQTLGGIRWQAGVGSWTTNVQGTARNHGDHFRWDVNRPGFSENRHRTTAADVRIDARRTTGALSLAIGASGGIDRVRSSNLGNHRYSRVSGFGEIQLTAGARTTIVGGLRADRYSAFGSAVSPTASLATTLGGGFRLRASAGHAYRIPTFTELYYSDPNTLGRVDLRPERGWTVDGGLDWQHRAWTGTVSVFGRWDRDVIDFVRARSDERFQATNIRDVAARGVELSLARYWARTLVRVAYTGLHVDAPALSLESRYVLEYARHSTALSVALPLGRGFQAAVNVDHRLRRDGQHYALVGARLSRTIGRLDLFVDGTNLFDVTYTEIAGVAMPGRWISGGVTIR